MARRHALERPQLRVATASQVGAGGGLAAVVVVGCRHYQRGHSNTTVGTVSTPGPAATSLATSMQRWRLTSAATADSAADQRSGVFACWRGNAAGLGGWTFVSRLSLATLQATGMDFFGLYKSTAALSTTLT